jgi:hypothetical protein
MPHFCGEHCCSSSSHEELTRITTEEPADCSNNASCGISNAANCSDCEHGQPVLSHDGPPEDMPLGEANAHEESNILPKMTKCTDGVCCVRKISGNSNESDSMPSSALEDVSPLTVVKIGEINGVGMYCYPPPKDWPWLAVYYFKHCLCSTGY